jgi:hypothetical protein
MFSQKLSDQGVKNCSWTGNFCTNKAGERSAGMQISSLDDNLSQLLIVSAVTSVKADTTSLVLNGVMRVCREMGVQCQLADE